MVIQGKLLLLFFLFIIVPHFSISQVNPRSSNSELISAISGAMLYLEDSQLRHRITLGNNPLSPKKENWEKTSNFYLAKFESSFTNDLFQSNKTGIWESKIHFIPKKFRLGKKSLFVIPDFNLFINTFITFPFYLFKEDSNVPGYISQIKYNTMKLIRSFKRGDAYNFWMELPGSNSQIPRTGPPNIPIKFVNMLSDSYLNHHYDWFWSPIAEGLDIFPKEWVIAIESADNPTHADAYFNIPDDADDTSVAVATQRLFSEEYNPWSSSPYFSNPDNFKIDNNALMLLSKFRDLNRNFEDGRDNWKGENTGAYLTWLKSEYQPMFSTCESGVIPLAVNNVDCVINANILFSLALNNMTDLPGFNEAIQLMNKTVKQKAWPKAGLYYPQFMVFPYCLTRAFREGKIDNPVMKETIGLLLKDLLQIQQDYSVKKPELIGAFPGGEDQTHDLSTALGLCSLLNIGEQIADSCGMKNQYVDAIEKSVIFLLKEKKIYKIKYKNTFSNSAGRNISLIAPKGFEWDSGLFFSSSFRDLASWRSKPLTVAIVMEALTKYLLEYDKYPQSILSGPKIHITSYPEDALSKPLAFEIQ